MASLESPVSQSRPESTLLQFADQFLDILITRAKLQRVLFNEFYRVPTDGGFRSYLVRLEQVLAVRCAGMEKGQPNFLSGQRDIIQGNIDLVLSYPQNVAARLLLAQTVLGLKYVWPEIAMEFKDKVETLHREHQLPESAHRAITRILNMMLLLHDSI